MLAFVTPIRNPVNSSSYERVGALLDATLRSVCRQIDSDFHVFVVHNERPPVTFESEHVTYVQVDFPPPSLEAKVRIPFNLARHDKGTKNVIGTAAARDHGAQHVMLFDADDYLHRGLSKLANASPNSPGWYSPQGYIHTAGTRNVNVVETDFHRKNGSTSIVRTDLLCLPGTITTRSSQQEIFLAMGIDLVDRLFGGHGEWDDLLQPAGLCLEAMPFPAAIWEIGTGENRSGNLHSGRRAVPIDPALSETFGLTLPSRWSHAVSRSNNLWQRIRRRLEHDDRESRG